MKETSCLGTLETPDLLIYLPELLSRIPPYIVGGDVYHSEGAFGHNARYLDFESNVECIFDAKTLEVYELSIVDEEKSTIWRKSDLEEKYLGSVQELLNLTDAELETRRCNVADIETMIKEVNRHYGIV